MDLGQLDAAIRLSGIAMILLLGWLLFRQRRKVGFPALLFAPMAVCLSAFLIGNTPDPSLRLYGSPGAVAHFASGCAVVFLWWFCLACFDRQFRPRGGVLAVALGWIALAGTARMITAPIPALSYALLGLGFGIVAHLVWRLYSEREGDLIQKRYDARAMVALILGGLLLIDLLVDLFLGFAWRPRPFAMAQNGAILIFSVWLAGRALEARAGVLSFDSVPPVALEPSAIEPGIEPGIVDEVLRRRLIALMEVDRVYLDPDLTFASFVKRMSAPERAVRKLVNYDLGFDHFRSFLNHYRVMEARRLLADPCRSGDKLIAIALDSGFASLASFNRVFRTAAACTPSQYKDAALGGRPPAAGSAPGQTAFLPTSDTQSAAF